jgi:penicillin-binding protein 1B
VAKNYYPRELKVRVPKSAGLARFVLGPVGRVLVAGFAVLVILGMGVFSFVYVKYSRLIDEKLKAGPFAATAKIYAAPEAVAVGDVRTPQSIGEALRRSGYTESRSNPIGSFQIRANSIEIYPGPDSYFDQEPGVVRFVGERISQIISLADNTSRSQYQLEPQLITNLSGPNREKRRFVTFPDIPRVLVEAVTSAEDKRFFQHAGLDPVRIVKAAYVDLKEGRKEQGASTLSQQLARMFWLDQDKSWTRKLAEVVITLQIEQKLSKEQIFEDYANQVPLGMRGTFSIHGFGEAAEAYLGKDLSQINAPEAAELAGMIQRPPFFNPFRHPDHTIERRNVVLGLMRQNGFLGDRDYALAVASPLTVAKGASMSKEAPYFVDMVGDDVQNRFQDQNFQANAFRIYTTLDMRLQAAAEEAIRAGMQLVDEQIKRQRRFRGQTPPEPQVALVAIDPHTGEVRALAGGRNYGTSQLNHVLAKRQPGSVFKPFVYAAALDTAVDGGPRVITASTILKDEPTTFWFDGKDYSPKNFDNEYRGDVTLREALAHSLNNATVSLAEMVGYGNVVAMANRAGMNYKIQPTPAVALGAYEITPLEAAGAYTMFANQGVYVRPSFVTLVRDHEGKPLFKNQVERKPVLDPRVAYLTTNLMEEVLRSGTGAGVRSQFNFTAPAAGKTGTSSNLRDGWFAGYTTELLCVVWVGFDDNRDLDLEGARSAAPIWGDFMKRALAFREYRDAKSFPIPAGIVSIEVDSQTGMPATSGCPKTHPEVFIVGTEPEGTCPLHGGHGGVTNVAGWDTSPPPGRDKSASGAGSDTAPARDADPRGTSARVAGTGGDGQSPPASAARRAARQAPPAAPPAATAPAKKDEKTGEKKSLFQRILGVFK